MGIYEFLERREASDFLIFTSALVYILTLLCILDIASPSMVIELGSFKFDYVSSGQGIKLIDTLLIPLVFNILSLLLMLAIIKNVSTHESGGVQYEVVMVSPFENSEFIGDEGSLKVPVHGKIKCLKNTKPRPNHIKCRLFVRCVHSGGLGIWIHEECTARWNEQEKEYRFQGQISLYAVRRRAGERSYVAYVSAAILSDAGKSLIECAYNLIKILNQKAEDRLSRYEPDEAVRMNAPLSSLHGDMYIAISEEVKVYRTITGHEQENK